MTSTDDSFAKRKALIPAYRVHDLLEEELRYSMDNQDVRANQETQAYLTGLLARFTLRKALHEDSGGMAVHQLLAEMYAKARSERGSRGYSDLGDLALFMSGFFSYKVRKSFMGPRYYADMGRMAYGRAADIMAMSLEGKEIATLYTDLSDRFPAFRNVLEEVADRVQIDQNHSLINLLGRLKDPARVHDVLAYRGMLITVERTGLLQ